ncbi:hypothetical protein ACYOEI_28075, partial [Singulisphaera rosea]
SRRRVPYPQGVPAVLSDKRTWILAHGGLAPTLLKTIDRLYDDRAIRHQVVMGDVLIAAWALLLANYELTDEEITTLLEGLPKEQEQALAQAVMDSLFGSQRNHRTYSEWALASLYAAGIEPSIVPPQLLPDVLDVLVMSRRTIPASQFISSSEAAAKRSRLLQMVTRKDP